jgi:serine/threonine-protein kinase
VIKGKTYYMAPEQVHYGVADPRSDLYAFGAVLHEMLTGEKLFGKHSAKEMFDPTFARQVSAPSRTNPLCPTELDALTLRLLSRLAEDRHQTCAEAIREAEAIVLGSRLSGIGEHLAESMRRFFGAEMQADEIWLAENSAPSLIVPGSGKDHEPVQVVPTRPLAPKKGPIDPLAGTHLLAGVDQADVKPEHTNADPVADTRLLGRTPGKELGGGSHGADESAVELRAAVISATHARKPGPTRPASNTYRLLLLALGLALALAAAAITLVASGAQDVIVNHRSGQGAQHQGSVGRRPPDWVPAGEAGRSPAAAERASKQNITVKPPIRVIPANQQDQKGNPEATTAGPPSTVPHGSLQIEAPLPLEVYLKGKRLGRTPLTVRRLRPGPHVLSLKNRALGIERTVRVQIQPAKLTSQRISLGKGVLRVNAIPWARVRIDGKEIGLTPLKPLSVIEGTHQVELIYSGADRTQRFQARVAVGPGKNARLIYDFIKGAIVQQN